MAPDYRAALATLAAEMEGEAEERDDCCYEVLRSFAGRARALLAQEPAPETRFETKVVGSEIYDDGTTGITVVVPGRYPVVMSTPATLILPAPRPQGDSDGGAEG